MAVTSAGEAPGSPKISLTQDKITITREFIVGVDDVNDGYITVTSPAIIPRYGQIYIYGNEENIVTRCRALEIDRMGTTSYWKVVATYESPTKKEEKEEQFKQPTKELPEIETSSEKFDKPVVFTPSFTPFDSPSHPIATSAGEIYSKPVNKDDSRTILSISRNEYINSPIPSIALQYQNSVNNDVFWGVEPGRVKCHSITWKTHIVQLFAGVQTKVLRTKYEFHFAKTWDVELLDFGSYYKETVNAVEIKKKFLTWDNHPYHGFLDGSGHKLADGLPPVFLPAFQVYPRLNFAPLNLPQNQL